MRLIHILVLVTSFFASAQIDEPKALARHHLAIGHLDRHSRRLPCLEHPRLFGTTLDANETWSCLVAIHLPRLDTLPREAVPQRLLPMVFSNTSHLE